MSEYLGRGGKKISGEKFVLIILGISINRYEKNLNKKHKNKIRKIEPVSKAVTRKKNLKYIERPEPSRKRSWKKLQRTLENNQGKNRNIFRAQRNTANQNLK